MSCLVSIMYVWDGAQIIAEYSNGSLIRKYIYGPGMDRPAVMIHVDPQTQAETWYYYYADALGSVRLMTDAAGYPVEGYTYDPYGRPTVMTSGGYDNNWMTEDPGASFSTNAASGYAESAIGNPYLFTGRRWHSVTGLYYYRFRDYDPVLGRFLQTDPAGYVDTMNLYAYCGNNPVNWIDPWGLKKWRYHWYTLPVWPWVWGHNLGESIGEGIEGAYEMYEDTQNPEEIELDKNGFPVDTDHHQSKEVMKDSAKNAFDIAKGIPNTTITGPAPTGPVDVVVGSAGEAIEQGAEEPNECPK